MLCTEYTDAKIDHTNEYILHTNDSKACSYNDNFI